MSTYGRFIEANHRLIECYQAVPIESWTPLSASEKQAVCQTERQAVQHFLENNSVSFANLVKERLSIADHQ